MNRHMSLKIKKHQVNGAVLPPSLGARDFHRVTVYNESRPTSPPGHVACDAIRTSRTSGRRNRLLHSCVKLIVLGATTKPQWTSQIQFTIQDYTQVASCQAISCVEQIINELMMCSIIYNIGNFKPFRVVSPAVCQRTGWCTAIITGNNK